MAIRTIKINRFADIAKYAKSGWIYRGQGDEDWGLKTSFDRCCDLAKIENRRRFEWSMIREFRRAMHHYAQTVPESAYVLECLSHMQHHGAPTRLLDLTYSIYIATYFAVEGSRDNSAVWGLSKKWCVNAARAKLIKESKSRARLEEFCDEHFDEGRELHTKHLFFDAPNPDLVFPVNPFRLNERLRTQKGVFLITGNVDNPFDHNLDLMPGTDKQSNIFKLIIPKRLRMEVLAKLFDMNISRTSLFPGLDGFAGSLSVYAPFYKPVEWRDSTSDSR